jgi:hypothetical protein
MGIKRVGLIAALLVAVALCVPAVSAADGGILSFGRVYIYMPEIAVELKGAGYDAKDISASLGTETLTVSGAEKFDAAKDSVCTYMVVDLSTSMRGSFAEVRAAIQSYVETMKDTDRLVLITFGKSVKTVLSGGESKADILKAVSALTCNESGTLFYEAMNTAYELANANRSGFSREYALVFSDGMDYQKGSSTYNESMERYKSHTLPLYAVCAPNASKEAADTFGEIARASGGSLTMLSGNTEKVFGSFLDTINEVTLLTLKASSNVADGSPKQLSVKIGEAQAEITIPVTRSIPDTEAPEADKITFDPDNNTLAVHFSESVQNADRIAAFDITEEEGSKLSIFEVKYFADSQTAALTLEAGYTGNYTIRFNGITDASKEANALVKDAYFKLDQDAGAPAKAPKEESFPWLIVAITGGAVLIAGIIVIILCVRRRKKRLAADGASPDENSPHADGQKILNEYEPGGVIEVKHHIKAPSSVRISLRVKTGRSAEQRIEVDVSSSLIVGRSDICDVFIDDNKMSRQHFVIENGDGMLSVTDLGSTNGTLLNGIKIGSPQRLRSGDKLSAGLSDIRISFAEGR